MRRWLFPLVAVAAFGLLLYYVVGVDRPKPSTEEPESTPVLTFDAEKADRLEIRGPEVELSVVKRSEDGYEWWLQPQRLPANGSRVESLLLLLGDLRAAVPEAAPAAGTVGLDRPAWRVDVYQGDARLGRLEIGDQVPVTRVGGEMSYYARANGRDPVFTVSETLMEQLRGDLDGWRERYLSDLPTPDVVRVELNRNGSRLAARREGEKWQRTLPRPGDLEAEKMRDLIRKVTLMEAEEFVSDAPSPAELASWGLDRPWLTATLATGGEKPLTRRLLVGQKLADKDLYYARLADRPWVYAVDTEAVEDLVNAAKELGA
ncbi:MAG: DUF4340 domain-containing protein [Clostridia bacterium]|nr:DUF4340 domain-containing protein [Clostridia bacterium]MDH7572599.1 DUF4340 domain-containing protein [Clostridia bacterium]